MIDLIGANGFEEVRWEPQFGGISSVYSGTARR
jgi:hypothetical protein